ncbi:Ferredoxin--NADP(+) reductase, actinobacterial (eukaryote-like) type, partial [hydrothermal vent metagenome]
WGIIPNQEGRIADSEHIFTGFYVAGWIKRGPSGVIGTNKPDSEETVAHLMEDLKDLTPCKISDTNALLDVLKEKKIRYISKEEWKKIDAAEIKSGEENGKPREKFVCILDVLHELGDS